GYSGVGISRRYSLSGNGDFAAGFHDFTVDWTAKKLTWSVDGHLIQSVKRGSVPGRWAFDHPFFVVLNLSVGNPFSGLPDAGTAWRPRCRRPARCSGRSSRRGRGGSGWSR